MTNGEASLALKQSQGNWLTSMIGYTLAYNTLDNPRDPHLGIRAELSRILPASAAIRASCAPPVDIRGYHELYFDDMVGIAHLQAGDLVGYGSQPLRIVDNFNLGPSLVRGFAPGGIGPRDISNSTTNNTRQRARRHRIISVRSLEAQFPIWGLPRDIGLKGAVFSDAGSLWGYHGNDQFRRPISAMLRRACPAPTEQSSPTGAANTTFTIIRCTACIASAANDSRSAPRSGLGLIWASPMGPIRFNYAFATVEGASDVTQAFSFSGGTSSDRLKAARRGQTGFRGRRPQAAPFSDWGHPALLAQMGQRRNGA